MRLNFYSALVTQILFKVWPAAEALHLSDVGAGAISGSPMIVSDDLIASQTHSDAEQQPVVALKRADSPT